MTPLAASRKRRFFHTPLAASRKRRTVHTPLAASRECRVTGCTRALYRVLVSLRPREAASGLIALLALLLVATARADADWKLLEEHWYILEIDDQPAGWMSSFLHQKDDHLRGTSKMIVAIDRAAVGTSMEIHTEFIETRQGKPISMSTRHVMSQQPVETNWRFETERIIEVSRQGGREMTREHPLPEGTWLTPLASRRYKVERMAAGAEEVTYRAIDPTRGIKPMLVTSRRDGRAMFQHEEREVPVTVWRTTSEDTAPLEAIEHFTTDGHLVHQKFTMGFGELVMRRATREEAIAVEGAPAPELFMRTVVETDRPIHNAMRKRSLRMRMRARAGELPELPTAGAQRVTMAEDRRSALLVIDMDDPVPATEEELADEDHLTPSPMIDSEDALVRALARRAVRMLHEADRKDVAKRAEAMRAFAYEYIANKGLDTAFASASETARTRTGDCTEHAVLLAALLRADGIPSRTASGLVYIDEFAGQRAVFGWHMWTQALINEKWIDLDATLPVSYHAGHITTSVSSLADGGPSENGSMMMMIGNLEIEVLENETADERR